MTEEPPLGAHLTSPRWGYLHHGIYAGQGRVIHYAGLSRLLRRGPVEEVPIERFSGGKPLRVKAWAAPRFSGAAVVERARARIGEDNYRVWSNNCEHFASWCVSGLSRSAQVDRWTSGLRRVRQAVEPWLAVRGTGRRSAA